MPTSPPTSSRLSYGLTVATFCLLWSSAFAVAKLVIPDCPPFLFLTARYLIAGLVTFAIAWARGMEWRMGWRDIGVFALVGALNNAIYLGFSYHGMQSAPSGLAAILISTNPVLTAVLAAPLLGEKMSLRKALGLLLGVGGVVLLVQSRVHHGAASLGGVALLLAALLSLVAGTLLFKILKPKGSLWIGNGIQSLASVLLLAPLAFGSERLDAVHASWQLAAGLAYLALLGSVLGYFLWFRMLTLTDATTATAWHFVMPPLGLMFGFLLLGERVPPADLIGILPVILGIWLVTRPASPGRAKRAGGALSPICR